MRGFGTLKWDDVNVAFTPTTGIEESVFGSTRVLDNEVVYDWKDVTFTAPATRANNLGNIQFQGIQTTSSFDNVRYVGNISVEFPQGVPQYNTVFGSADTSQGVINAGVGNVQGYVSRYSLRLGRPQNNNNTHAANRNRWTILADNDFSNCVAQVNNDDDIISGIIVRGNANGNDFGDGLYKTIVANGIYGDEGLPIMFLAGSNNVNQFQIWWGNTVQFTPSIAAADDDIEYRWSGPGGSAFLNWTLADTRVDTADNTPVYTTFSNGSTKAADGFFLREDSVPQPVEDGTSFISFDFPDVLNDITYASYSVEVNPYQYFINEGYSFTMDADMVSHLEIGEDGNPAYSNTNALTVEIDNRLTDDLRDNRPAANTVSTTTSAFYAQLKRAFQAANQPWPETTNTTGVSVDFSAYNLITTGDTDSVTDTTITVAIGSFLSASALTDPGDDFVPTSTFIVNSLNAGDGVVPTYVSNALIVDGNFAVTNLPGDVTYSIYAAKGDKVPLIPGALSRDQPESFDLTAGDTVFLIAGGEGFKTFGGSFVVPATGAEVIDLTSLMEVDPNWISAYSAGVDPAQFEFEMEFRTGTDDTNLVTISTGGFAATAGPDSAKFVSDNIRTSLAYYNLIAANYDALDDDDDVLVSEPIELQTTGRYLINSIGGYASVVFSPIADRGNQLFYAANLPGQYTEAVSNRENIFLDITITATLPGNTEQDFTFQARRIADDEINLAVITMSQNVQQIVDAQTVDLQGTNTDASLTSLQGNNDDATLTAIQRKVGGLYGLV